MMAVFMEKIELKFFLQRVKQKNILPMKIPIDGIYT